MSEIPFNYLLERLPAGAYTCDPNGLITYFNQHAVEIWGRAPELLDPIDRFCGSFKLYAADGTPIPHQQCWMALALRTGESYDGREIIIERPDGKRLTALAHANPIRNAAGELVGAVNVLVDISDRKRAEEAQALLASIVETSEDAIISKTLDGRILSWNKGAERLFGYVAAEAVGQFITVIIPPDRQHEEQTILARLRAGERIEHYETIRISKSGQLIDISLTISPIRDGSGRIIGVSKIARDISTRKRDQEALAVMADALADQITKLREVDRTRNEFLATLAHELRNPLAPIGTAVQILRLRGPLEPDLTGVVGMIDRQVRQMTRLVDDLLEIARITSNKLELRRDRIALADVLRAALETSRPILEAGGQRLDIIVPEEAASFEGDLTRLSQVVSNLLHNAVKYTERGGQISLSAACDGRDIEIVVRDTGIGIPPAMLSHIFDMFTQVDDSRDRSKGGLGIGLTLVKRLVELHGGTVTAWSAGLGQGSAFTVRLPVAMRLA